jgi:hypothetical protein
MDVGRGEKKMRFGGRIQPGTSRRDGSASALEPSLCSHRPRRRVAVLPWLALLVPASAISAAGCGSFNGNAGNNPDASPDTGVDATAVVDAQPDTSSGVKDATVPDSPDTSAPDSAQADAKPSDSASNDGTTSDSGSNDGATSDSSSDDAGGDSAAVDATSDAAVDATSDAAPDATVCDASDGSIDCCPGDPFKTAPGVCGCGVSDIDSDGDGLADCVDPCPFDATKTGPGVCGCGVPDVDTDGDGVLDCLDGCPTNPARTTPGPCGCSFADNTPLCLEHRYSFKDGAQDAGTTVVTDSIGHANGTAVNVTLTGAGSVTLAGTNSNQYISLPSGIISALGDNATFEGFVSWTGIGGVWQRFFDFGANSGGPGMQGAGTEFLFVTPLGGPGVMLASFVKDGVFEADSNGIFPVDTAIHQFALVMSSPPIGSDAGGAGSVTLYVDGQVKATLPATSKLSTLLDQNNWLGRSQFAPDPGLSATYYEFRIYSAARTAPELLNSAGLGHNVLPTQ